MNITQTLTSQACDPHGALGWITALVMPLFTDSNCGDLAGVLDLRAEDHLLEVACGSGAFLKKRASHVRQIAGIDQSDVQIRMARRRHRERIAAGTAEIVRGDGAALPWKDQTFSAVTCNCIGCFTEPERSLREMFRVLRPGGRAVFSIDYCPDEGTARRMERKWRLPYWTESEFETMLQDIGFSTVSSVRLRKMVFVRAVRQ